MKIEINDNAVWGIIFLGALLGTVAVVANCIEKTAPRPATVEAK